jgi:hypothetical protein
MDREDERDFRAADSGPPFSEVFFLFVSDRLLLEEPP